LRAKPFEYGRHLESLFLGCLIKDIPGTEVVWMLLIKEILLRF
jgi:hypothetical protein